MRYIILLIFPILLSIGCKSSEIDYREAYLTKNHVIDITLPPIMVADSIYTFNIYTHPHTTDIQYNWYYGGISSENIIYKSVLHPLNNSKVDNPYKLKWGIESDFGVSYVGSWILVIITNDIYGNTKIYKREYRVHRL
jgi:hypothetical protein